jgi:hypothetical protein
MADLEQTCRKVGIMPISALRRYLRDVRFSRKSGLIADIRASPSRANMYGLAVRCKTDFQDQRT